MRSDSQDKKQGIVGFRHAINGIKAAFQTEFNLRIHVTIGIIVIIFGWIFQLNVIEWAIIILTIGMVLVLEMINTTIEKLMDYVAPEIHPMVGRVKDMSAGAVLIFSIVTVIIGVVIFLPKLLVFIQSL